jgi:serine/threonine protein kinase
MVEYNHVHPESWPTKSSAYTIDEVIGSGTFGLVWKATCITPPPGENKICAIKILDLEQFPSSSIGLIR